MPVVKNKNRTEFGDFQTPYELARKSCELLHEMGISPQVVLEPTCGEGSFLLAGSDVFKSAKQLIGIDINASYIERTKKAFSKKKKHANIAFEVNNFFEVDWKSKINSFPEPILIIGNPPWVTNSELGSIESKNLPMKTNFQGFRGLDALTGKSNFDISEWMLVHLLTALRNKEGTLAMLCKNSVARKVLSYVWRNDYSIGNCDMFPIDASKYFGVSVDACLLVCTTNTKVPSKRCQIHTSLSFPTDSKSFGLRDGELIADVDAYERQHDLVGQNQYRWRSGIKHDCAKLMEVTQEGGFLRNGLGEEVDIEEEFLYPLLKSSDLAGSKTKHNTRWLVVPQRTTADDTKLIERRAPKLFAYLKSHSDMLDRRKSGIYKNRARFSIFGVGEYSFTDWKVGVSGLYKRTRFKVVGPAFGKPVVLDDTCYFTPCQSQEEAELLALSMNSDIARDFFSAFQFLDSKRPMKAELLGKLDTKELMIKIGVHSKWEKIVAVNRSVHINQGSFNLL